MADNPTPSFKTSPYSEEVFTPENKQKFDELAPWQRQLVNNLLSHGDMEKASRDAGVARYINDNVDLQLADQRTIKDALTRGGLTSDMMVEHIKLCLEAECIRFDSHRKAIPIVDLRLKLETLRFIASLRGDLVHRIKQEGDGDKKPKAIELFQNIDADAKD